VGYTTCDVAQFRDRCWAPHTQTQRSGIFGYLLRVYLILSVSEPRSLEFVNTEGVILLQCIDPIRFNGAHTAVHSTHTHMHYIYAQPHKTHTNHDSTRLHALPVPQPQRLAHPLLESPSMLHASPCTPPHPSQYLPNIRSGSPATEPAATRVGGYLCLGR